MTATVHRRPSGEELRLVEDGARFSVFLFAPAALLARRLWGAFAVYLVLVCAFVGAATAGWLSGWAAVLALFAIHLMVAIDMAHRERERLQARGWPIVALSSPGDAFVPVDVAAAPLPSRAPPPPSSVSPEVLGLFPGERA